MLHTLATMHTLHTGGTLHTLHTLGTLHMLHTGDTVQYTTFTRYVAYATYTQVKTSNINISHVSPEKLVLFYFFTRTLSVYMHILILRQYIIITMQPPRYN